MEFVSHGIFKMTGYTPEEMINNSSVSYIDIIHPEDRINVKTTIKEALKNDQNYQVEYRIITKTKQTIWVTEIGKGIKEGDKTQYLEGFITDITQQKQAQEELIISQLELEKSVSLFKALSGASFEAIFISKHGVCIGLNRTAELMFGYSEEEALGKKDTQWFVPEDHERIKQRLLGGSEEPYEGTALRIDGETFPCEIKTRVAEYQGNMVLFTSITNISRRKEAQKNLLESEARYRELIQNNTSVMLLFDPLTGEIVEANKAACAFYGLTEKQLKETRIFDLNTLDQKEIEKELSKLKSGEKSYFVFKHYTARGIIKDVELYTGQINYRGRMLYFSVIHDITEKLQNQRDLIRAKEKAEESDKLKSAFLANMSHEIRTPMNAILGFSQLLTDSDTTPDEMTNYIQIINQSGQQLLELIDDIIKISQIEAGIITLNYQETNLTALLNEMQALFSLQVKQKEIDLNLVLPTDPIKTIYTDPARLKQVLINLLSNAVKFTHQGGVSFGYVREGDHLKFYVQDSGIGINATHHKLIFDRFMQVRQNKNKLYGGTGIGLSISKALVEKMNGTIWLTSEESKGTTFYFTLPIAGEIDDNKHKAIEIVTHQPVDILRNKHILIVEDDESNRSLLVLFLKSAHVILHFAENGIEAIEQVKQVPGIAAVLMDIKMPGMGGIEATIEIKKLRPGLPVIIQTAYAMANEKEEALKAGSNAYLAKPLERQALINELILQITKSETQG
jgi:PAS domain S-box-containing protein